MKNGIKDFLDLVFAYLVILPVFWLIIQYGAVHEKVKELYYIVFKIPYYKAPDKFHSYVVRTDR